MPDMQCFLCCCTGLKTVQASLLPLQRKVNILSVRKLCDLTQDYILGPRSAKISLELGCAVSQLVTLLHALILQPVEQHSTFINSIFYLAH